MKLRSAARVLLVFVLGSLLFGPGAGRVAAEVGGIIDPATGESDQVPVYMTLGIGDDPDPIGWVRYRPDSPSRKVLNDQGDVNGDGPPAILWNPVSRMPLVAWSRNSAGGYDVVISRLVGGAWSAPEVLAGSALDELDPQLAVDPATGDVHLFWWVDDTSPRVMHRQAPADLSSWTAPDQVSAPAEIALRPAAVVHGGDLYVSYEVHDWGYEQTPRQVVLSRLVDGSYQPEVVAITHHAGAAFPRVRSHAGWLWVEWVDAANEVAWTRRGAGGTWDPVETETFATPGERDYRVRPGIRSRVLAD